MDLFCASKKVAGCCLPRWPRFCKCSCCGDTPGVVIRASGTSGADPLGCTRRIQRLMGRPCRLRARRLRPRASLLQRAAQSPALKTFQDTDAIRARLSSTRPSRASGRRSLAVCTFTQRRPARKSAAMIIIANNVPALYSNASAEWLKDPAQQTATSRLPTMSDMRRVVVLPIKMCVQNPRTSDKRAAGAASSTSCRRCTSTRRSRAFLLCSSLPATAPSWAPWSTEARPPTPKRGSARTPPSTFPSCSSS